jgi:hypothetical protein
MSSKFQERKCLVDVTKALKISHELCTTNSIELPMYFKEVSEFTPEETTEFQTGNILFVIREDFEERSPQERLDIVLDYLRSFHFYCIYCAAKFSSEEELSMICPGKYSEEHEEV